ncbi:MAG TPA: hypothetical protein PKD85_00560, partial [Saprospiraceae bacterium]|nr:hypothetical protein [Saprospiraceae bacterium]
MSLKSVNHVQFGALTEEEWRLYSVVHITTPINRGNNDNTNTPYDLRLGALENGVPCGTCGEKNNLCPGHFGHIELYEEVYNPEYLIMVLGIIKCICIKCKSPRIPKNSVDASIAKKKSKFTGYRKKAEILKQCTTCMHPLPSFFIEKYTIKMFFDDKKKATPISAREMKSILMQISSDTMRLIGFNEDLSSNPLFDDPNIYLSSEKGHIHEVRPESFIMSILPVIPPCARPWIVRDGERKDDDITDAYNAILKLNNKLYIDETSTTKKKGATTEAQRKKILDDLTANIWSLIDNSKDKNKNKNNARQIKGISNRLKGKDGHFQYNVGGKRVDFSARTPIIPGGSIVPMGWIGIPQRVAEILTIPELVLQWNINALSELLAEGKINSIVRQGKTIPLTTITGKGSAFTWGGKTGLQQYDIVHRQLRNGDWGLFNRQPTLRIESMQGVQVMILPPDELAFRIPLGMTRAFNADCDGDEMNLHIPQVQAARVECSTISRTAFHLISGQNCAPIMGCVQNTLVCNYLITETFSTPEETDKNAKPTYKFRDGTDGFQTLVDLEDFLAAIEVANISSERYNDLLFRAYKFYPNYIKFSKGVYTPKKKIPGKIVASIVYPRTFTWSRKTDVNEFLPIVKITKGIIEPDSGPICKKTIGGCSGSAIHALWKISPNTAMNVITELQFMTTVLITRIGFSMGIADCIPLEMEEIQKTLAEALIKCELVNNSSKDEQEKEIEISSALNEAMGIAPRLAKTAMNKQDRNALVIQKKSGAKGSDMNNGQISGFVGPQSIDGRRMPLTLSDNTRALPHFKKGDNSPEARGFVKHSFLEGLTYQETWFHAAAGRRGVVDTAMKSVTRETRIMIAIDKKLKFIRIGDWIDNLIDNPSDKSTRIIKTPKQNMETLKLTETVYIPTVSDSCIVTWGKITAVTRHDPTTILYQIKTRFGRTVTVTDSKSLLIYNFARSCLEQTFMKDVEVGFFIPVTKNLPYPNNIDISINEEPEANIFKANIKGYNTYIDSKGTVKIIPDSEVIVKNDIILDQITEITECKGVDHKYVYDLTVPSTTNFCLANGLHVVDTADSGYIQKKIVKKIEDCKTHHDGTIRDANGCIIQFLYGGDGLNAQELIPSNTLSEPFFINFQHISDRLNSEAELLEEEKNVDIGKLRVLKREEVDLVVSFILAGTPGFQSEITERATFNTKTIIRSRLSNIKIYEYMIPMFCRKIKDEYEEGKSKMGYMGGLVAASSMGEPTTQLSVAKNERVILMIKYASGKIKYINDKIGVLVDSILEDLCSQVEEMDIANGISSVGVPDKAKIYINTVNPKTSKSEWKRLQEVSRHPANGKLVKVTTKSGRVVTTTLSHSHLKKDPTTGDIIPVRGDQLEIGHFIPICGRLNTKESITEINMNGQNYFLNLGLGRIFGSYLFKDHIEPDNKDLELYLNDICYKNGEKVIPAFFHFAPYMFIQGLIGECSDSTLTGSKNFIENLALLHARFGYFGSFKKIGDRYQYIYVTPESEDIIWDKIEKLEILEDPKNLVYDLGVLGNHTFMLQSGVYTHNTLNSFHFTGQSAKDVTLGVPRLKELLNSTKNPSKPSCTIYVKDKKLDRLHNKRKKALLKNKDVKEIDNKGLHIATRLSTEFADRSVNYFTDKFEMKYLRDPKTKKAPGKSALDFFSYQKYKPEWWAKLSIDFCTTPDFLPELWVITLELNLDKLYQYSLTPKDIALKIEENFGHRYKVFSCIASPTCIGKIDIYINLLEIGEHTHGQVQCDGDFLLTPENIDYFVVRDIAIKLIKNTTVVGIKNITKTFVRQLPQTGEWVIDTQGTNLLEILSQPNIDTTRTISDEMWEIYKIFGIEAARKFLIEEITRILSFDGTYINPRHICLLVDA